MTRRHGGSYDPEPSTSVPSRRPCPTAHPSSSTAKVCTLHTAATSDGRYMFFTSGVATTFCLSWLQNVLLYFSSRLKHEGTAVGSRWWVPTNSELSCRICDNLTGHSDRAWVVRTLDPGPPGQLCPPYSPLSFICL